MHEKLTGFSDETLRLELAARDETRRLAHAALRDLQLSRLISLLAPTYDDSDDHTAFPQKFATDLAEALTGYKPSFVGDSMELHPVDGDPARQVYRLNSRAYGVSNNQVRNPIMYLWAVVMGLENLSFLPQIVFMDKVE